ncbi:MAG: hypothetical protein Q4D06_07810 [Coriobacteriia bacterium]|nr:hypothetical protein [Coriobacteriia bacterium]
MANGKKSRIPLVLGVLVLAAVIGAALGFVLFQYLMTSSKCTVEYNASQKVEVSKNTVIIPKKDESNPLDLYTVLLHAEGGENVTLVKTDTYGFTFADAEKELPDGTYTMAISLKNGKTVEGPALVYKADSFAKTEVSIVPANSGQLDTGVLQATEETFDKATMYKLYKDKVQSLQKRVGKATIKTDGGTAYLGGLAYAELIDFAGDGIEELVVAYYDSDYTVPENCGAYATADTTKAGGLRHYHLGVYEFVPGSKNKKASLHCVFSGLDAARNLMGNDELAYYAGFWYEGNGSFKLRVSEVDGQRYLLAGTGANGFKAFMMGYKAGRFQAVTGMTNAGSTHSVDGMSQSQSVCDDTQKQWTENCQDYVFNAASEQALKTSGKATTDTVSKTLSTLKGKKSSSKKAS